ncbi:hypothetical protein HELRODRAFT_174646 [Helobdella robusta]|uniref:Uncharacterized protein n=1 Tax=Helobdella robusta TaxID=6412 RepID=T1F8C4_HELRO|nr:hypothetical protein HELRODRAFT_174646 [Helobdella robusta]ESO01682.1 hypothetical protein HELRODRAFT_174646 [Helobdella robusta]
MIAVSRLAQNSRQPSSAIDNNDDTYVVVTTISIEEVTFSWLSINFGKRLTVFSVKLTNAKSEVGKNLKNFTISVSQKHKVNVCTLDLCYHYKQQVALGSTVSMDCQPGPVSGQHMIIERLNGDLVIAEVLVYAKVLTTRHYNFNLEAFNEKCEAAYLSSNPTQKGVCDIRRLQEF